MQGQVQSLPLGHLSCPWPDKRITTTILATPVTHNMNRARVRPSLFPGFPPFLTFLAPGEQYPEDEDDIGEIAPVWSLAPGTSSLIVECLQRSGVQIQQVGRRNTPIYLLC